MMQSMERLEFLLENDGTLAITDVVDKMLREAPALEFSSYAPLKGLPRFS